MLQNIGQKKPKFFAIIDLTKGYYQAPLSEASKQFTAFITATALYEWNRVPMGLMGAVAYFQRIMQTVVLAGLIHVNCEVYIDDIIIYGNTKEEYLRNLKLVFQRLRKYKLTANPTKTRLGLDSVQYVGHIIDSEGCSFSRDRLDDLIAFETPVTKGDLKSFLGKANYLRTNIENHSTLTAPLDGLLKGYQKNQRRKPLEWTDDAKTAFIKCHQFMS
jgi:hypothetical protein